MKFISACILLLFLSGCSESREIDAGTELRSKLLQASGCSFSMDAVVDSGQHRFSFSMDCTADQQGSVRFTVTEPETISGISGTLSAEGGALTFEDTVLDFSFWAEEQLSPVSGPWILLHTLRSGYITSACREEDSIRLTIDDTYQNESLHIDIWLDPENLPEHADILHNGRCILSLDVRNFTIV